VKKLFAAAGALGASVVISSSAMADTVTRTPSPVPTFTVTGVCLFPFQVHPIINNEYTLSFVNQNGVLVKQITTGALVITFTNLGTGKSITENVSGPSVVTFNSDGSVTVVMLGTQGGTPANAIGAGRTVFKIAADGTFGPAGESREDPPPGWRPGQRRVRRSSPRPGCHDSMTR
jgi:hypothetical protein